MCAPTSCSNTTIGALARRDHSSKQGTRVSHAYVGCHAGYQRGPALPAFVAEPRQPNRILGQPDQQSPCLPSCGTTQTLQEAPGVPPRGSRLPISTSDDAELRRVHSDEPASRVAEVCDAVALPGQCR